MAEVRHTPFTDSSPSHIFLECLPSLSSCPSAQSTSSLFILSLQLLFAGHPLLYCSV